MNNAEIIQTLCVLAALGLLYFLPKKLSQRRRFYVGAGLLALGCIGIGAALALGDTPMFQNETLAFAWVGMSAGAVMLGIILLVPVVFEHFAAGRRSRGRRERWPSR